MTKKHGKMLQRIEKSGKFKPGKDKLPQKKALYYAIQFQILRGGCPT